MWNNTKSRRPVTRRPTRRTRLHSTTSIASVNAPALPRKIIQRGQIVFLFLAVILFSAALYVLFATDLFYADEFQIEGAHYLTPVEIQRASGVAGFHIFFIDSNSVAKSLLRVPEIKTATVTTGLFNRVQVTVEERQPIFTWWRGNETYWVDSDGIGFTARAALSELPALRDLENTPIKSGQRVPGKIFDAWRALREAWPDSPRVFEWSNARGIALTDERGWKIYFGDANEMPGKVAILRALVPQLKEKKVNLKFIDLGQGEPFYQ
ncbi:MAG: FtsQ-type POTRA domain-containing protein [Chloroflexi bacterium]|nr:FtsQ-type POTRA domain-containing protein [Chloroflexota bacterium]